VVILLADGTDLTANRVDDASSPTFVRGDGTYQVSVASAKALSNGAHQIFVAFVDVAGNVSAASTPALTITINALHLHPPTIMLDPTYDIGVNGQHEANVIPQQFDGTSDPGTTVVVFDGGIAISTSATPGGPSTASFVVDSTGHFTRFINLPNGQHSLTLQASDSAGNHASSTGPYLLTVDTTLLDADRKFVSSIYSLALGRPGTAQEWNPWLGLISLPNGRFIVADSIERSFEARDHTVIGWYQTYLGRTPQNGEEIGFVEAMLNGFTEEQTLSLILGSPEYKAKAQTLPGARTIPGTTMLETDPDRIFVRALYLQLLGRTASPGEVDAWVAALPSIGRGGIATAFLNSFEYRTIIVTGYYSSVLRRTSAPSAMEVQFWVVSGIDLLSMKIDFEASPEFFFRVTGQFPLN
jgi:hypothetical protein